MMANKTYLRWISGFMFGVGAVALLDGYAEFASGEESMVRWLLLPTAMFLLSFSLFQRSMKKNQSSEASDA